MQSDSLTSFLYYYHLAPTPTSQRRGQFLFNILCNKRPDLAEQIRGGDHDPFYDNTRIDLTLAWIIKHWDEATLIVYRSYSECGACGRQTLPDRLTHDEISGYGPKKPGCGARFVRIAPGTVGCTREELHRMRPDLPVEM